MATKQARKLRQEFRKNGHIIVEAFTRKHKRVFGLPKVEAPESAKNADPNPDTHTYRVQQTEASLTKFKVVPKPDGIVEVFRKNGSGLKPYVPYIWTGLTLRPAYIADPGRRLTHEQLCTVERSLIRL